MHIGSKKQERNLLNDLYNRLHETVYGEERGSGQFARYGNKCTNYKRNRIANKRNARQETRWGKNQGKQEKILFDEQSTKYFFNMEKRRGQNIQIKILKKNNEDTIENQMDTLEEITDFYRQVYSTNGHDEKQMQENLKHVTLRLNNNDVKTLNKPISEEEIENSITSIKK